MKTRGPTTDSSLLDSPLLSPLAAPHIRRDVQSEMAHGNLLFAIGNFFTQSAGNLGTDILSLINQR